MRATLRSHAGNRAYWRARWDDIPADDGKLNLSRYPGRYAEEVLARTDGPVLEAGCGAGRVLRCYHDRGRRIVGMDFIPGVLHKIRQADPSIPLVAGDVTRLAFADASFAVVLAFGLYHNLEQGLDRALAETRRILRQGGLLCASFRADNLQNRVIDFLADRRAAGPGPVHFHKMNYTRSEIESALSRAGLEPLDLHYVENMPFLYKVRFLRHPSQRVFDERHARAEGYRLSAAGKVLQRLLAGPWPEQFCNVYVYVARAV